MYVHLKEPVFECTLPISKCLDKNIFRELRKKTSEFGMNLIQHINQESTEGNLLGWMNLDQGSMSSFGLLIDKL